MIFADTFYYLALLNPSDRAHLEAVEFPDRLSARLITTEYVLLEIGDALSSPADRAIFCSLLEHLKSDSMVLIVPSSTELFERGRAFYEHRPDKDWSLTDCISFVVMAENNVNQALTADHHFEQAGFTILFSKS